ncbi:filamentous hemagglutinin family protein [Povalibacter uvarum]|uniref:Filamentous hemagglutinin family protein n=1 Tax=Povalibacter uvarum TaxID=732238 RepID=A0A841HQR3_9GAMM|nr:filamentous hemagglutinin N-terminal domain-containing protein [Povalibacter uvarum]MBB6095557.1 filamentous hemagglutinin family protein [Povalibacter uvarum]
MNTNKRSRYLAAAISAVLSFAAASAQASPQNGNVTAGSATINQPNANDTTVTQTSNSVSISWDSFDLDGNDSVVFVQPSSTAVALNRILDADPSSIMGSITANGRIFLMNANGIIFGSTATVNVGSLVATSLDLDTADAVSGIYTFDAANQRGEISNAGNITAGSVALFGGSVLNNGMILANLGSISLGAGRAATVSFDAGGLINFQVDTALATDTSGASALVNNTGTLQAEGGQVLLTSRQATSIVANAVNNGGTIIATGISTDGGTIRLVGNGGAVANTGTLNVSGSGGNAAGSVVIDGRSVNLGAATVVDVAGATTGTLQVDSAQGINAAGTLAADGTTTLNAAGTIVFGATTAGTLNATAGGTISQNSSGITAGAASFTTLNDGGASITLGTNTNSFASIGASVRNTSDTANTDAGITIREGNDTTLSGNLRTAAGQTVSVNSAGVITQSNAITAAGNITFTGASTTLNLNNTLTGSVGFSGVSASLTNAATTTLGTTNLSAGLTVNSTGGQLTQSGAVSAGSVTLSSNNNVVLNNTLSSTGTLSVTSGGNITQTGGTVSATGATTFTAANGGSIEVARVGNNFGNTVDLAASGGGTLLNVALRDASALTLQALTVTGDLDITASAITQSGTVNATTGDVTLTSTSGATALNTLNAATLTVNSAGAVTQSGGLTVTGLTQVNASGQNVTLTGSNAMSGGIGVDAASASIANTGTTVLRASTVTNGLSVNSSGTLVQTGVVDTGSLTLTSGAQVIFGEDVTTGALTVTAATDINQNVGTAIDASGAASFTAGNARSISVNQSGNDFGDTVTFAASSGQLQNVAVRDSTAFELQALDVTGSLNVQAATIEQAGVVTAAATTLTSAGTLELGALTASSLTANAGGAVTQTGALNVTGVTQFNATGQTVTLGQNNALSGGVGFDSGAVQLTTSGPVELRATTVTGTFNVNANGAITQSDAISASGATTLSAGAGTQNIILTEANSFSGGIGVTASDAQITNSGATELRASNVTNALNVTSSGALSQTGIVSAGSTTLTSSGNSVTLGNNLSTGALTVTASTNIDQTGGAINATGAADFTAGNARSISVNRNNTFGGTVDFSAGSGTLQSVAVTDTTAIQLQQIDVTGDLTVTSTGGDITQSDSLSAGGTSTFIASGRNVTLTDSANALSGPVRFTAATASLANTGATNLGTSTLTTSLSVDSTGALTQSGTVNVVGGSTILGSDAGVALNTINTGSLSVDAGGTVTQTGVLTVTGSTAINAAGQTVTLSSANALTGNVTVTAANASLTNTLATTLAGATVGNSLTVNSTGAITQSGAVTTGGTMALNSGAGVALNTSNAGALTVSAGGAVTQTNALTVAGTTTITAAGQDVTLGSNNALSGGIAVTAANASITNSVATDLLASTLSDSLSVSSGSAITQSGALDVSDTITLSGASVALNTIDTTTLNVTAVNGITQSGTLTTTGATTLNSGSAIALNTINTGTLNVTAGGAVTQTGALTVTDDATISATGQDLTLNNLSNDFRAGIALSGATVSVTDSGPVNLLASNVTGNLAVRSLGGGIGQSGALNVGGTSAFTASGGESVTLADSANSFGNSVSFGADGTLSSVTVASAGNIDFGGLAVSNALNVSSGGSVSQSGNLYVGGTANLAASGGITLSGANEFGSINASSQGPLAITQGAGTMNLRQVSSNGSVRLEATNGSIVDDVSDASAALISSNTGIELRARDTIGTVTDLRTRQGTAIAVNPGTGTLSANVTSTTGQINLALASGSNPSAAPASITSGGNGRLLIQSGGDLSLDAFDAAIAGFSEVGFSSDGTLSMPGAQADLIAGPLATLYLRGGNDITRVDRTFALSADTLVFESGGQGGSVTLNTDAGLLDANLGGIGNLTIADANDLTLGTISAGGNVLISAANIADDGDTNGVTRVNAGNVSLTATGSIGSATNRIDTNGTAVAVQAGTGSVFLSHAGDVEVSGAATAGGIDVEAASGNITVASTLQAGGPLTLTAGSATQAGNIVLAGAASSGSTATLSALGGGTITDTDDASTHLTAQTLSLSAAAIGEQANRLSIGGGSVNATADAIHLQAANALQLRSIAGQTVVIGANGALTDDSDNSTRVSAQTLTLSGGSIGAAGNEVDTAVAVLSASTTAGGIFVSEQGDVQLGTITAAGAGNDIAITASGAITGDGATRIAGNQLSLSGSSIGAAGAELGTQVASLTATSTGGVYVNEADDLQLNAISGTDVSINAAGALTDDSNDSTRVTASNVRLSGTRIGAGDNRVDTAAGSLTLVASNGGIYFAEQDDVALAEARSSGTGNTVDGRTGGNGSMSVQTLVTQGGAVNLAAGGTGSLTVTGAIESNNGVVNLTSGNALALPGLDTGSGAVVLRTVNDLNVGTITASSVSITSDTGNVSLGTINAAGGTVTVTANNGAITDGTDTSLTAGQATMSARSIGGPDQALNIEVDNLTATATGGGIYINDGGSLTLGTLSAAGEISLVTTGALTQTAGVTSNGSDITLIGSSINMQAGSTTVSGGGNIAYVANNGDVRLSAIDASNGRALVMGSGNVYSTLSANSGVNNLTASGIEIRAGGLNGATGEIGTLDAPIAIAAAGGGGPQSVFLIVPALNGIQTTTPSITYSGPSGSLLLKGYTGSAGVLLFDMSSTFSPETILSGDETIVPLRNGRVAVNSDSLAAAKQALSSGVIARVNVDWAAFDPNVSLFGTLDPSLRLPADQVDEAAPAATLIPEGTVLLVSRDGWRLKPAT